MFQLHFNMVFKILFPGTFMKVSIEDSCSCNITSEIKGINWEFDPPLLQQPPHFRMGCSTLHFRSSLRPSLGEIRVGLVVGHVHQARTL